MVDLFTPVRLGELSVRNRIVLPPLTRGRSDNGVPNELMATYYRQRSGAGLLVSEGTLVGDQVSSYPGVPGIHSPEQIAGWRLCTEAVHEQGAVFFCQLWHLGRNAHSSMQADGLPPLAPSAIPITSAQYRSDRGRIPYETPREMSLDQIEAAIRQFGRAARNALAAGFDGVELHAANGYLFDQFLNSSSNRRTDLFGGSRANRMRFHHRVLEEVLAVVPAQRVGIRLSPSSVWMDVHDPEQAELYSELVSSLNRYHLAYLHLVEPEIAGAQTVEEPENAIPSRHFRDLFEGPVIRTGEHSLATANRLLADGEADLIGFGRSFIANPDLPRRLRADLPLNQVNLRTLYTPGPTGYIDYPTLEVTS